MEQYFLHLYGLEAVTGITKVPKMCFQAPLRYTKMATTAQRNVTERPNQNSAVRLIETYRILTTLSAATILL